MDNITVMLNHKVIKTEPGCSVLEFVQKEGIAIPTLCKLSEINCVGACRMCIVNINGKIMTSCTTRLTDGMNIETDTQELEQLRKANLEMICYNHRQDCSSCDRFPYCELHTLCRRYGIDDRNYMFSRVEEFRDCGPHMIRDNSKCIQCRRCVSVCNKVQGIGAIGIFGKGTKARVENLYTKFGDQSPCVNCGQCITACPTGALMEKNEFEKVGVALAQKKELIAVLTPTAAIQLAAYFGTDKKSATGKTIAALHRLGFRAVFDSRIGEEEVAKQYRTELEYRLKSNGKVMISTHCPSTEKLLKQQYPNLKENIISIQEPLQYTAKYARENYAKSQNLDSSAIQVITISSCTAEKYAQNLTENKGLVDVSLTTHELYQMMEKFCVSSFSTLEIWKQLEEESFDYAAAFDVDNEDVILSEMMSLMKAAPQKLGIKNRYEQMIETEYSYQNKKIKIGKISGLKGLQQLLKSPDDMKEYVFIEALACPGGCINGAGKTRKFSGDRL